MDNVQRHNTYINIIYITSMDLVHTRSSGITDWLCRLSPID
jgi:hypothetical protein